jgi:hypothetical protein
MLGMFWCNLRRVNILASVLVSNLYYKTSTTTRIQPAFNVNKYRGAVVYLLRNIYHYFVFPNTESLAVSHPSTQYSNRPFKLRSSLCRFWKKINDRIRRQVPLILWFRVIIHDRLTNLNRPTNLTLLMITILFLTGQLNNECDENNINFIEIKFLINLRVVSRVKF